MNAKSSSRRDRRRRSLAFCSLSFRGGSSFSRSHHARGDLTLSFPRGVSKRNDSRRFEIPRHDHCAQKPPPPRHDDGEKKEGRSSTQKRERRRKRDHPPNVVVVVVVQQREGWRTIPIRIISRRISTTGRRQKSRGKKKSHELCFFDAPALPSFCATNVPSCWLFLCHWSTFARFSMASSAASSKRKRQYAWGSIDDDDDDCGEAVMASSRRFTL